MPSSHRERPLYKVLGISPSSTVEEITRAYRRLALQYHPDRNPDGAEQFKELSNAYYVLSDPVKKGLYDATGIVEGVSDASEDPQRTMKKRSDEMKDQVRGFFAVYAGSAEEREDVVKSYVAARGDFAAMIRKHLLFDNGKPAEVRRLYDVVCALLLEGKLRPTDAWNATTTPKAIKKIEHRMQREREEAEKALREMNLESENNETHDNNEELSLQALIKQRQKNSWESMLNHMEAKYIPNENKASKKRPAKRARESLH
ncbi:unnamed protein product [Phytomonas sp. EM1]|nr:unnamed protein product [Phytomonas sp. EM1]|eukprot:CCW63888.1 unnamed protein product [Phytomonas sp. isolate EM1]